LKWIRHKAETFKNISKIPAYLKTGIKKDCDLRNHKKKQRNIIQKFLFVCYFPVIDRIKEKWPLNAILKNFGLLAQCAIICSFQKYKKKQKI
jgi:hypothetical protein